MLLIFNHNSSVMADTAQVYATLQKLNAAGRKQVAIIAIQRNLISK